ncbi:MAG: hypothetical protein JWN56_3077 [Sphingobacteriales bacterium]|nr:hypothetical protein [Sphingobacteriales bacterium]
MKRDFTEIKDECLDTFKNNIVNHIINAVDSKYFDRRFQLLYITELDKFQSDLFYQLDQNIELRTPGEFQSMEQAIQDGIKEALAIFPDNLFKEVVSTSIQTEPVKTH